MGRTYAVISPYLLNYGRAPWECFRLMQEMVQNVSLCDNFYYYMNLKYLGTVTNQRSSTCSLVGDTPLACVDGLGFISYVRQSCPMYIIISLYSFQFSSIFLSVK